MAAYLVNQLRKQQIEVHFAESGKYKGDYVVLLDQPYRDFAVSLLSDQHYPKAAKFPPYDDIAWTLGPLYGVKVKAEDSLKIDPSDLKLVKDDVKYSGKIEGSGSDYVLNYKAQNSVISALYWLKSQNKNSEIVVLDTSAVIGSSGDTLSAGSIIFKGITGEQAKTIASKFGLDLTATGESIEAAKQHGVTLPRVAIYHTWFSTQDEGWARFTFEQWGVPYTSLNKDNLKAGNLRNKFDVILIPNFFGSTASFINGIDTKFGPMPYKRTAEYPALGYPDSTNDMTGGPGFEGLAQLKQFVDEGGVLITTDNATKMVSETGFASELKPYNAGKLFHPGSIVQVKERQPENPVLYGFPEIFYIFRGNAPLVQVAKYNRNMMLLQYGTKPLKDEIKYTGPILGEPGTKEVKKNKNENKEKSDPYVLSGLVRNEKSIIGQGSIFDVPVGAGRVIAFTFNPLHRFLNQHDTPMVWNVLINWNHL